MKKIVVLLLSLSMVLTASACKKKPSKPADKPSTVTDKPSEPTKNPLAPTGTETDPGNTGDNQNPQGTVSAPEGTVTDETKLGESITYWVDGDHLYFKIKTSAEINAKRYSIGIVNRGIYLTRNSELINQEIYVNICCLAEEFDKEWFEGYYVFGVDNSVIKSLASDESEWAHRTWSMLLYNEDTGLVLGQWLIVLEGGGKYHFEFKDSWLYGAGEDRKVKEFDSLEDEVASWFDFKVYSDEWSEFYFDGYYLEQNDSYGYDSYYLMICPEGDYTTYDEASGACYTYSGVREKCPYLFSMENGCKLGRYTFVLARDGRNDLGVGGNVEIQFEAEKINATEWKMDFSNAKCPALQSKYEESSELFPTAPVEGSDASDSEALKLCGLTVADIRTNVGTSLGNVTETPTQYVAPVFCADSSFDSFESWLYALADNCRKAAKDGNIYESEFTTEPCTTFELDPKAINIIQFVYKTVGHTVYVTASSSGSVEGAFSCNIQIY